MPTIKDIAKNLGLSFSTISRALNDHPSISDKTKELVKNEAKRLNFTSNVFAKGLTNNKSYTVTLIVNIDDDVSFQNPYFYEEMYGIERYVYQKEYSLIVANMKTMIKNQNIVDYLVKSRRTDGIILPSTIIDDALIDTLHKYQIPFVSIGQPVLNKLPVSWVDIDNQLGTNQAAKFLINKGHKNIAFLGLDKKKMFSVKRCEGYKEALITSNLEVRHELIVECENTKDDGYKNTQDLFKKYPDIDAIICADELISIGVIKALSELGKSIPKDVSIISFDSSSIAQISYPAITTIDVDLFELGYQSAKILFEHIEHNGIKNKGLLIGTEIIERETTE
ncbi:LacI family DNA-binding transcriptional regulator [Acholeplasma laidlawii]|uniref:LacI family DNA-binding transcriptional regulator n=1 Tax=Acholeplasma laidlawii TaxID=2148 RepID=UPI0018C329FC|nr:LacI family DNA-binding transcriptional regulator [Acholeplasma laidlawii]MBG0762691.1 LacI family DNA-binding transcriptional regulator [Acholeplasma laidlawii]